MQAYLVQSRFSLRLTARQYGEYAPPQGQMNVSGYNGHY